MIQQISNIKKLFHRYKPGTRTSADTEHGTRCIMHVINLALLGLVMILAIASTLIYYLVPIVKVSEWNKIVDIQKVETGLDTEPPNAESATVDPKKKEVVGNEAFSVINEKNVFSHKRKDWVVKAVIPKSSGLKNKKTVRGDLAKRSLAKKKAQAGKPKKIILHGIVIAGDVKKALINNPLKGVSKKKTLYVEVGDELEGYKVTSIEKDRIRLDWHGEEIVILLYSGLKDFKQGGSSGKIKPGGITRLDYEFKIVEDGQTEERLDVVNAEVKKVAHADMLDETSLNLVYKESEYFAMQVFNYLHLSDTVEMLEVGEEFSDIKTNGISVSAEKNEALKIKIPMPINSVAEQVLMQKFLFGKPSEILLSGIVIVAERGIKKALVNIPVSPFGMERTLCVEEGDSFEGYKVTSIEPGQLRLDLHGEEIVMTIHSGLMYFAQDSHAGKSKQEGLAKLDSSFKVGENAGVEDDFNDGVEKIAHENILEEDSRYLVYKESGYFSKPSFKNSHLPEAVEVLEVAAFLPDIKSNDVAFSIEKQIAIKTEIPKLIDSVTEGKLMQMPLTGKLSEILLNGIVIVAARDIKKALINIPMSPLGKERTLSVEEGDSFEGYKVTSIESDRLMLDWHGEEMVMTVQYGLNHFKQNGYDWKSKQEALAKLDSKHNVVEGTEVAEDFDVGVKKTALGDILDETSLSLVYKEPESFSMPVPLSEAVEIEEDDALFPYRSFPD